MRGAGERTRTTAAAPGPTLGVVVPTLNEAELLPRLLERLTRGEPRDRADAIVVADGGSDDGTLELVLGELELGRASSESTLELGRAGSSEPARGSLRLISAPRGRGVQLAAGARALGTDVLLFLHADSLPEPGALAALRAAFADPAVGATAMRQRIDRAGAFYRCVETCADLRARLGVVYGDSGLALRRALYDDIGGFRPLPVFEDVDLSRRLRVRTRVRFVGPARLRVSARRWEREGALRCTLRNWMLSVAFLAGADPERLARRYEPSSSIP